VWNRLCFWLAWSVNDNSIKIKRDNLNYCRGPMCSWVISAWSIFFKKMVYSNEERAFIIEHYFRHVSYKKVREIFVVAWNRWSSTRIKLACCSSCCRPITRSAYTIVAGSEISWMRWGKMFWVKFIIQMRLGFIFLGMWILRTIDIGPAKIRTGSKKPHCTHKKSVCGVEFHGKKLLGLFFSIPLWTVKCIKIF